MKIGGIIWLRDIVDKLAFNHHVEVDEAIVPKLNEIAKSKKVPSEKFINTWLREKIETSKRV